MYLLLQMSNSTSPTGQRACCENGRPIMTNPHTGQTICSCQYESTLLSYSRVPGLPEGMFPNPAAYGAAQYVPLGSEGSAFYSPLVSKFKILMFCLIIGIEFAPSYDFLLEIGTVPIV